MDRRIRDEHVGEAARREERAPARRVRHRADDALPARARDELHQRRTADRLRRDADPLAPLPGPRSEERRVRVERVEIHQRGHGRVSPAIALRSRSPPPRSRRSPVPGHRLFIRRRYAARSMFRRTALALFALAASASCNTSSAPSPSSSPRMDFTRPDFYAAPFPSDDLRAADGTISLAAFPNPDQISLAQSALGLLATDARGFAATGGVFFSSDRGDRFERAADPLTERHRGRLRLLDRRRPRVA